MTYAFGFHPTASRAVKLLDVTAHFTRCSPIAINYHLCALTAEHVISFCIDATHMNVVDVTDERDWESSNAPATCVLVVDDHRETKNVETTTWKHASLPKHFTFLSMGYSRAMDWVKHWARNDAMGKEGVCLDMRETYTDDALHSLPSMNVVELTLPSVVHGIADGFLYDCRRLTYLDTASLTNVSEIGAHFLENCSALTSLDLSPLSNVCEIEACFLAGCSALSSLDLSPLTSLSVIGDHFLDSCSSLFFLDLSRINSIDVGDFFLHECSALKSVDLSPLMNVSEIGAHFLSGCSGLTSLDLSPLTNVADIRYSFLEYCSALVSLDLSPLTNVTAIEDSFLECCSALTLLDLSPLSNVSEIGAFFLAGCSALTFLDLSPLTNVSVTGDSFLCECSALKSWSCSFYAMFISVVPKTELNKGKRKTFQRNTENLLRPSKSEVRPKLS
eukprot:PhM_4_TR3029/c0_g4_i4/m.41370